MNTVAADPLANSLRIVVRFADGSISDNIHRVIACESTESYLEWYARNLGGRFSEAHMPEVMLVERWAHYPA